MSLGVKHNAEILSCSLFSSSYSSLFFSYVFPQNPQRKSEVKLEKWFLVQNIIFFFSNYDNVVRFIKRNQILICIKISHQQFVEMLPFHTKKIWCNHSFYYKNYLFFLLFLPINILRILLWWLEGIFAENFRLLRICEGGI